jgi:hypothetical protein
MVAAKKRTAAGIAWELIHPTTAVGLGSHPRASRPDLAREISKLRWVPSRLQGD